jgi:hypothetical protein
MAFTPSSSPLQYQYKPLNLMAFAEPLAKMQEKYDLTKSTIEDSDVKATSLQWAQDPEKAKALEQIYRNKRDELAQNLAETKNYTQAASKIKKLQRLWNEDPERLALESNYKLWEERNKEEIARVGKPESQGGITKQQYLEWVADEKRKFESEEVGGTNFRRDDINPNGTYNPVTSKVGREADRQKELDELKYKVAGDMKAKKWSSALSSLGIDPESQDAKYMQSEFERLTPEEIDQKVEQYVRGLDRFKPWLNEVADYNFKNYKYANDKGASYNELTSELLNKNYNANEQYIKSLEAAKKKKDKNYNEEDYKRAIRNKELLREQMDNPDENVIKDLFNKNYLNKQYDARALGDIFEVNNSSTSYTFRDIPKEDGGGGDGSITAADLAEGAFTPNKYLPIVGNLKQQEITAGKGLFTQLVPVHAIAGGIYGNIILGAPGSKNRESMSKNPGAQQERAQRILLLANNSANSDEFYKKLIAHGFTSGTSKQTANSLFSALQNKETKAYVTNQLQNSQENYNNYVGAKEQIQALNETVLKDKQYSSNINKLGLEKYPTSLETVAKLAKSWGKTLDQMIESGVVEEIQYEGENGAYTEYYLSGNNLAQVNGYNSLDEAVKKGASIGAFSKELGKDYQLATTEASNRLNSGQVMSHTYVGDKKLDDAMTAMFTSVGSLEDFTPVETKNWDNTLGFDEEGNLAPGTSFDFANGQSVKLVKHGNNLYYQVPITVASEDGAIKRNILVKPKAGTEKTNEKFYQYILQNSQKNTDDPTSGQTYDMAASGLYDLKNKSNLNDISAESFTVDYGDAPLVLETVPGSVPGVNIQIVKVASANGKPDQYKVQMVNAAGTRQFVYANDGTKEFSSPNINAAKVRVSELLYQD